MRGRPNRGDALLVGYALAAALCRPLTAPAAVAVGVAVLVLVVPAVRRRPPPVRLARRHAVPWVVLLVLVGAWELTAVAWGDDPAHPTLSLLLDPVLETYPGRVAGWLVWLGAGRWLVTR